MPHFAMYMQLSVEQEKELLRHYMMKEADQESLRQYNFIRPLVYLNKVTWPLVKAFNDHATSQMLEAVWPEDQVVPIVNFINRIYTQIEGQTIDHVRYARSAYEQFYEKRTNPILIEN